MKRQITQRQQVILDFIIAFRNQTGYSPTFREIMKAVGIRSPNAIAGHLSALRKKGAIEYSVGTARSIVPVGDFAKAIDQTGFEQSVYSLLVSLHGPRVLSEVERRTLSSQIQVVESYYLGRIKEEDDAGAVEKV